MRIDTPRFMKIYGSDTPVADMLSDLENFADTSGGALWRHGQARRIMVHRAIDLFLDEEPTATASEHGGSFNLNNDTAYSERIAAKFSAERISPEIPNDKTTNLYQISFTHTLPLFSAYALPDTIRDALNDMKSSLKKPTKKDPLVANEIHKLRYRIQQDGGDIEMTMRTDYVGRDFLIEGEKYSSSGSTTAAHGDGKDKLAHEYYEKIKKAVMQHDHIDDLDVAAQTHIAFNSYLDAAEEELFIAGQPYEDHAMRVMSLLAIIKSNLR